VTFLSSRTHCATNRDMEKLMRIVRYLEVTSGRGVCLNCESLDIKVKCDAAYAVHTPGTNTKGHTGFIVGLGDNMSYVHARSGKQKTASTSSTDAEVIGLVEALKFVIWLRNTLTEMRITDLKKVCIYQDNKSVIMMGTEYTAMKHSKHILTKITFIRSTQLSGAIDLVYLNTEDMTADVLSKALHGFSFNRHISSMMGLALEMKFRAIVVKRGSTPTESSVVVKKSRRTH
jgi:ribonuclease HI